MSNYLVDNSVLALPSKDLDKPNNETIELLEDYFDNLNNLLELIGLTDRNYAINQFLFCSKDISNLINSEMFLDISIIRKLWKINLSRKTKNRLKNIGDFFQYELPRLRSVGGYKKPEKLCSLETYVGIEDIKIKESSLNELSEILQKNISKLAFLNGIIYLNSDITKMLSTSRNKEYIVNVFIESISHKFNNVLDHNINIESIKVINNNLQNLKFRVFPSIDNALECAVADFGSTIILNENIYDSIDEYEEVIAELRAKKSISIEKVDHFKIEYPFMVYNCLDILDKVVKFYKNDIVSEKISPISKFYPSSKIGDMKICNKIETNSICKKCRGFIRICGFDCSDEHDSDVRIFDNKKYRNHIKPYTEMISGKYEKLSLRIYFRWDTDKIEVGYIGKHL